MSATALERALDAADRVERRAALAIVRSANAAPFADAAHRARLLALARAEGFTHLALELDDDADVAAPLPRDQSAAR